MGPLTKHDLQTFLLPWCDRQRVLCRVGFIRYSPALTSKSKGKKGSHSAYIFSDNCRNYVLAVQLVVRDSYCNHVFHWPIRKWKSRRRIHLSYGNAYSQVGCSCRHNFKHSLRWIFRRHHRLRSPSIKRLHVDNLDRSCFRFHLIHRNSLLLRRVAIVPVTDRRG